LSLRRGGVGRNEYKTKEGKEGCGEEETFAHRRIRRTAAFTIVSGEGVRVKPCPAVGEGRFRDEAVCSLAR
jgi:hypothetical protein